MNIEKDERTWTVKLTLVNKECPYLYYPANYHGCKLLDKVNAPDDHCKLEICPMRKEVD